MPYVSFSPDVRFTNPTEAILSGFVYAPAGIAGIEVYAGTTDLGAATLGDNGNWSIPFDAPPGSYTDIHAVATDTDGKTGAAASQFDLTTGVSGQPYVDAEDRYAADASYLGSTYFARNGSVVYASTFSDNGDGTSTYTYSTGTYFASRPYSAFAYTYAQDGATAVETLTWNDSSHQVKIDASAQTVRSDMNDTFLNQGQAGTAFVFDPGFGADRVRGFSVAGTGHDTLSLSSSDFASVADVLRHTHDMNGSAVIRDPSSGDTITLAGITTAELKAHRGDFAFHA